MAEVSKQKKTILLTFDVEDWFQVENFKEYIQFSSWNSKELRVEKNTTVILDLLDTVQTPVKATFFVLGWIAERYPDLVREINRRGHEVASHGFNHNLCYNQTAEELRHDLRNSKELLEEIIGQEVVGYRAPSFSITDEAIKIIRELGYRYDSSYNSYEGHGRYGSLTLPDTQQQNSSLYTLNPSFYELPVSNLYLGGKIIPWGGGGYFRLLPSMLHRIGVKRILKESACYTFYMHPWEIDPGQPRVKEAKPFFRFRHYVNLRSAEKKLKKLIEANGECSFLTCSEFITEKKQEGFINS